MATRSRTLIDCSRRGLQSVIVPTRRWYTQPASAQNTAIRPFDVLFFGRDEFSCLVLRELYAAKDVWEGIWVATQPDMKVGRRGSTVSISPLKLLGEELGLPVHTIPPDKPSFRHWQPPHPFTALPPPPSRLLITASFGRILSASHLALFASGRRLNVHPSLLPAYRGPAPIQRALLDGRKETGVCVIEMMEKRKGIDAGEAWGVRRTPIPAGIAFPELRDKLAVEGGRLLVDVLRQMLAGVATAVPQPDDPTAPRATTITADDALLDFATMTAADIVRRHKAISHQKVTFTTLKTGKTLQIHDCDVLEGSPDLLLQRIPEPGMAVYHPSSRSVAVRCASGTVLSVVKVQQQDRASLDAKQWWNGVRPDMRVDSSSDDGPILLVS